LGTYTGICNREPHILAGWDVGMVGRVGFVEMSVDHFYGKLSPVRHRVSCIDAEVQEDILKLAGIGVRAPKAAGKNRFEPDVFVNGSSQQVGHPGDEFVRVDGFGDNACWRAKASSRLVRVAARCVPSRAFSRNRSASSVSPRAVRRFSKCRLPMMTANTLLKSWASPPVSCPMASIFCD
jgi:hypothetical protein